VDFGPIPILPLCRRKIWLGYRRKRGHLALVERQVLSERETEAIDINFEQRCTWEFTDIVLRCQQRASNAAGVEPK